MMPTFEDFHEQRLFQAGKNNLVFTSTNGGKELVAIPLSSIPGNDSPDWMTMRVEVEIPFVRPTAETASELSNHKNESRRHFAVSPSDNPEGEVDTLSSYFCALFAIEELSSILQENRDSKGLNDSLWVKLNVYACEVEEYEETDDVSTFLTSKYIVSSIQVKLPDLVSLSGDDLVGVLLYVELDPKKMYLVRPEMSNMRGDTGSERDISSLMCFTFEKDRKPEIFDFFNDDEEEDDDEEDADLENEE